jgi:superfamily II DNA or RNA helicase
MPDIIDNRTRQLAEEIASRLSASQRAHFAVGYFFLSGFEAIAPHLTDISELRLLIGNTLTEDTIEQLVEGKLRLDAAEAAKQDQEFVNRDRRRKLFEETVANLSDAAAAMDQTDDAESLLNTLADLVEQGRIKVKVYTKGRLHAKAYIFDYKEGMPDVGVAIVGSSNLTLAGIQHNTELNVVVHGDDNHAMLSKWFGELWEESEEFDKALLHVLNESWVRKEVTPYEVYLKALYSLVGDQLDEEAPPPIVSGMPELADFQLDALSQAMGYLQQHDGVIVGDVVGLGKTYIGTALLKTLQRVYHQQALIICPKRLERMWQSFSDTYALGAKVLSMALLREGGNSNTKSDLAAQYPNHRVVLVDESHNFRHSDSQRYRVLQPYLHRPGMKAVLVTATPRNTQARDVLNQLLLWMEDDAGTVPINPPLLSMYFRRIEDIEERERAAGRRVAGPHLPDVLRHVMVRRTRNHINRYYPEANIGGKPVLFPDRKLRTVDYRIDAVYGDLALYRRLVNDIESMSYARYGLYNYVAPALQKQPKYQNLHRAGSRLKGLMKAMLLKRLESSVAAFCATLERLERSHARFLELLDQGKVAAGEEVSDLLMIADDDEFAERQDELAASGQLSDAGDFIDSLRQDIETDRKTYKFMLDAVERITPDKDAKLQTLIKRLKSEPELQGKVLLFTQFKDTADYLHDELAKEKALKGRVVDWMTSDREDQLGIIGRFAPNSNPDVLKWVKEGEPPIDILVSTDVLSEGLNLQDCGVVVNYDIHWNPVRLIQRVGRVDRIGVGKLEHEVVWGFNFLPDEGLDQHLNLRETVHRRIQEIHDTIGEDAKVLEETERLNTGDMYTIYVEGKVPEDDEDDLFSVQEAIEILRRIRVQEPDLFGRISSMANGVRAYRTARERRREAKPAEQFAEEMEKQGLAGMPPGRAQLALAEGIVKKPPAAQLAIEDEPFHAPPAEAEGVYVLCSARDVRQAYFSTPQGAREVDVALAIRAFRCERDEPSRERPAWLNAAVQHARGEFSKSIDRLQTTPAATRPGAQKWVLKQLGNLARATEDETERRQLSALHRAFSRPLNQTVIHMLRRLQRQDIMGPDFRSQLDEIASAYELYIDEAGPAERQPITQADIRVVCSQVQMPTSHAPPNLPQ